MPLACSVCGSEGAINRTEYGPIPLCDAFSPSRELAERVPMFPVDAYSCPKCGHAELSVKPPEEDIYSNYKYFSSNSPDLNDHFTEYAAWIKSRLALAKGAVHLDIGCNDGLLLLKSQAEGYIPIGVDPSPAVKVAQDRGLRAYAGYLNDEMVQGRALTACADVATTNNVLANVRDLAGFARNVYTTLKPGGYWVVETLHFPTLLHNAVFEMVNHEHYHYFSVSSIRELFARAGLTLVSAERVATKGANMRCVAIKPAAGVSPGDARIDPALMDTEKAVEREVAEFSIALKNARESLRAQVAEARRHGPVAGFGGSAGTTILLYLLGLQDQIDFLVDDNASRHGFHCPGSAIQIVAPAAYYERQPALTVIFAWRFGQQIVARHRGALPATHRFLLANTGAAI